jgi:hypothetical protein
VLEKIEMYVTKSLLGPLYVNRCYGGNFVPPPLSIVLLICGVFQK